MGNSTWLPPGMSVNDINPDVFTGFLSRTVPGLTETQKRAGKVGEEGFANILARGTGRQAHYLDTFEQGGAEGTGRRRGYQDEYKGLTQAGGNEMVDRFKAGGAGLAGKGGGGGGGGGWGWSGGGGGPSAASGEAVTEARRFQDAFGQKNEDIVKALELQGVGRQEAQAFARQMSQDTKYDKKAQDLFNKYEGQLTGRHEMDARTAALFDELRGQMQGNQYQDEAAGLIRGTTGDIMIDQTTPQIQAAKNLFNQTQGASLTNQMSAAGLGRSGARADVEARAWATQLPQLIANEQQQELAERAAQRDAAGQMFGMGQAESQRGLATFGAGQAANADIAARERGIQQNLMSQGIGLNTQQAAAQRQAQVQGYQAQAQALQSQAQAAMAAGDATKARELNAQANLMNAFGMRSGSEDAAAARAASSYGQEAALRANLYNSAEERALNAMLGRQTSLENMFGQLTGDESDIENQRRLGAETLMGGNERMTDLAFGGQQQLYDTMMDFGGLEQQNLMDQFNYDSSEIDRLRALFTGGTAGSTALNPAPLLTTRTSGGGKKG